MTVPDIQDYVVKRLSSYRSRDDLVHEICQQYDYKWDEAEALIRQIEDLNKDKIFSRRRSKVLIVNIGAAIGGFIVAAGMIVLMIGGLSITFRWLPIPYLLNIIFMFGGIGLCVRSIFATINTFKAKEL